MRMLLIYILLSFGCQQTTFLETENLKTSKSEKGQKSESRKDAKSQSDCLYDPATAYRMSVDCCPLTVDYYENQIRLADSLYKNYLPQYNFDEVKAAMEFFDSLTADNRQQSTDNRLRARKTKCTEDTRPCVSTGEKGCYPMTVDIEFSCAKAHYYHAVGLTERDDIVGACEHYLTALEIMEFETENLRTLKSEKRSQSRKVARSQSDCLADSATQIPCYPETLRPCDLNKEDYEKIRFLALTYTRLGRLFYNENYCDLSILKYKKALKCVDIIEEKPFKADIYKQLGNSYHLSSMYDSALYYYKESLETSSNIVNKLDVEKSIAQIISKEGDADSAIALIRNNLDKIENYGSKTAYYATLGEIFYGNYEYDSAIKYLKLTMNIPDKHTMLYSSSILSSIYDSIGNDEMKNYYDKITLSFLGKEHNRSFDIAKLQDIYGQYLDRKQKRKNEYEMIKEKKIHAIYTFVTIIVIIVFIISIYITRNKHKKVKITYKETLHIKDTKIDENLMEIEKITKENECLNRMLKDIKNNTYIITENNIIEYYNCDICKHILREIKMIEEEHLKINNISCLSKEDLVSLEINANLSLNGYIKRIQNIFPELKKQDIHCICLSLLNLNEPTIAALLGKSYNAVWSRMKKIRNIMNINSNTDLLHL